MELIEYKASMDTLAKIITLGIIVLLVGIGYNSVKEIMDANGAQTIILVHSGILVLFVGILVGSYLYSPQKYEIKNEKLIIKRFINSKEINLNEINEIRKINEGEMSGLIRTFGVGGLFGYYGQYHNPTFGDMNLYTTQRKNRILIKTKEGKKIVISPDDASIVVKEIKNKIK